jgi:predicted O-methyltransferase YrrM
MAPDQQGEAPGAGIDPAGHVWNVDDLCALQALRSLEGRYLPWSAGAMRPSGLVAILNEIVLGSRERIVECGSGISTVYIARLLAERGGRLISIEHDPAWARFVEGELAAEGLGDKAEVVRAPLEPHPLSLDGSDWYPRRATDHAVESLGSIDVLVVDGPPADRPEIERSRYPALPVLSEALAPNAVLILDDANRSGEARVLERWSTESEIEFAPRPDLGWIAIGCRR